MTEKGREYRDWILGQTIEGVTATAPDDDRIRFTLGHATAEINFYPLDDAEICELRVVRAADGDSTFFLHFDLKANDLGHARELFGELSAALAEEGAHETARILLTCTSAFTTSMFAAKMNEVASTLSLGYAFEALPLDEAVVATGTYAAIMVAPQAAYMRSRLAAAHPDALVFEIPGKVFGTYDAAGAIGLLMHALREVETVTDRRVPLKVVRDLSDDRCVLAITVFSLSGAARLGWRLYRRGESAREGAVRRPCLDLDDVADLIEMLSVGEVDLTELDAIGVAVPGVTYRGMVQVPGNETDVRDLGHALTERFGVPVYVDNNCNAAAVGCYVSQDEVENLVFFRHAFGHPAGGMGTVIDGRILKGHLNLAGEPKFFGGLFDYGRAMDEIRWTAEGMHEIARCVSLAAISIVAPDALYLSVDTVDDAAEFASSLAKDLGEAFVPTVHVVGDYVERVYLGTLAMALQKLRDPSYRSRGVGRDRVVDGEREWERVRQRLMGGADMGPSKDTR